MVDNGIGQTSTAKIEYSLEEIENFATSYGKEIELKITSSTNEEGDIEFDYSLTVDGLTLEDGGFESIKEAIQEAAIRSALIRVP
jgi:hypothetical protein